MNITRKYLAAVTLGLALLCSGCAITIGPPAVALQESSKPPVLKLGQINEQVSGVMPGGFRNYLVNALNAPAASSMFTKDGSGLNMQIDISSKHDDDGPRLVGLGVLSVLTAGVVPLHYNSVWPVKCNVKISSDDGKVLGDYELRSTGVYDIWAFPLTMFSLFGASMQGNADGQAVLQRTADDMVSKIMRVVDTDYARLAFAYRSQMMAKTDREEEPPVRDEARVVQSDVDDLPAATTGENRKSYAIVIGIERYRQHLPRADFAVHDAETVSHYLTKVLGYPEENVITLTNDHALKSDFEKYIEKWLANNVEPGGTVFFYFSGHGAPDPQSGNAYLVPYDGDPTFIRETGYPLDRLYKVLGKLPARKVIVALDSCFSGAGGRSVIARGARPLVVNVGAPSSLPATLTVLSASAQNETSSTYEEKGHGLFTYFMLKGIKYEDVIRKDGTISIDDLFSYVKPQVERIARKEYNNEQSPQLRTASGNSSAAVRTAP